MYIVTTIQITDDGNVRQLRPMAFIKKTDADKFLDDRFNRMVEAFSYDCGYDDDVVEPNYRRIKSGASGITMIMEIHKVGDLR